MNITNQVRLNWNTRLVETFGEDALFVGQELPAFQANVVNGRVHLFTGRATDNECHRVRQAVSEYLAISGEYLQNVA